MKHYFLAGFMLVGLLSGQSYAESIELPGWQQSYDESKNALVYNHDSGALVKIYSTVSIETGFERTRLQRYLTDKLTANNAPRGDWSGEPQVIRYTQNYSAGYRRFGDNATLQAIAFSADSKYARLGILLFDETMDQDVIKPAVSFLSSKLIQLEKEDAKKNGRNIKMEISPPKVKGLTRGVPFKPGLYAGKRTYGSKVNLSIEILFYDNGEYEYLSGLARFGRESGIYTYSQASGKFDVDGVFFNYPFRPEERYSVYGINENNVHTAYAYEAYGFGGYRTRLEWQAPIEAGRLTPVQRADAEKQKKTRDAAIAKAKRLAKKGGVDGLASLRDRASLIPASAILGVGITPGKVNYEFDFTTGFTIPRLSGQIPYLVLKDGTVISSPAPPADTDLAAYRKIKDESEQKIFVAEDRLYRPLKRGYTLDIYAEYNTPGVGGPTLRGLLFNTAGYFKMSRTTMLTTADLGLVYGKSVSSDNMSGTYFIDGNTIELTHNSGKTERMLFGIDSEEKILLGSSVYRVPNK